MSRNPNIRFVTECPARLEVGESATLQIWARPKWNNTPLVVLSGERYRFEAEGQWYDASIAIGPAGYVSQRWFFRSTEKFRRRPSDNWFALTGAVGRKDQGMFLIGDHAAVTMQLGGRLSFFANDLQWFYSNNSGAVTLRIVREM